jgi:chromosome partitioning protein
VLVVANRVRRGRALDALVAALAAEDRTPVAHLADRAAYGDLAAQGLSVFDRDLKSMLAIRHEWQPLVDRLTT